MEALTTPSRSRHGVTGRLQRPERALQTTLKLREHHGDWMRRPGGLTATTVNVKAEHRMYKINL